MLTTVSADVPAGPNCHICNGARAYTKHKAVRDGSSRTRSHFVNVQSSNPILSSNTSTDSVAPTTDMHTIMVLAAIVALVLVKPSIAAPAATTTKVQW